MLILLEKQQATRKHHPSSNVSQTHYCVRICIDEVGEHSDTVAITTFEI